MTSDGGDEVIDLNRHMIPEALSNVSQFCCAARLMTSEAYPDGNPRQ
jgi:hypothetical protein